ncbi:alpha/beta fold hydrolase [Novosphingobium sp. PP1Y]|uniref:alpha/beta fold hydrolase n=2 Tax=unclassified Novosphingobium TaxID=2644732 RepID=UPI0002E17769|nr:alpha/beta hydrolase [Novosphingobium sp. PP1Y]
MMAQVDRAFARIDEGLVHYRHAGIADGPVLLMLHASPGSSRGLEPLMAALTGAKPDLRLIAPDTLGNGDSAPPAPDEPEISYFADRLLAFLDRLGIDRVAIYGTHTGARIAAECALQAPRRISHVVFDGIGDYDEEMRALLLDRYAPEVTPGEYGEHLIWAFNFIRDQALHYPWFLRDPEHRLMTRAVPGGQEMHERVVELLKSISSYHKSYRAAFAYRASERLPLLETQATFLDGQAELPVLKEKLRKLAASVRGAQVVEVETSPQGKAAAIAATLD